MTDQPWAFYALCHQEGQPSDWDDSVDDDADVKESPGAKVARQGQAKAVCGRCPVQVQCMTYAEELLDADVFLTGIWFGVDIGQWRKRRMSNSRSQSA